MVYSGMQIDDIDRCYGNAIGLFDSIRCAGESGRKVGQETPSIQMTVPYPLSTPGIQLRVPLLFS